MPSSSGEKSIFLTWLSPIENRLQRSFGATLSPFCYIYHGQCSRRCSWRTDIIMWAFLCVSGGFLGMFGCFSASPHNWSQTFKGQVSHFSKSVNQESYGRLQIWEPNCGHCPMNYRNTKSLFKTSFRGPNLNIKAASLLHITWTKKFCDVFLSQILRTWLMQQCMMHDASSSSPARHLQTNWSRDKTQKQGCRECRQEQLKRRWHKGQHWDQAAYIEIHVEQPVSHLYFRSDGSVQRTLMQGR